METNDDFKTYLEKYASNYNLTHEEAEQHKIVQLVKEYYESKEGGIIK